MSVPSDPLTAAELKRLRVQLGQTPRSMAELLGVRLPLYYQWEREGKVSRLASVAVRLLAAQPPPEHQPLAPRKTRSSAERFQPGARFGRLVVLRLIRPGSGFNLRVAVQCDCGVAKTWQVNMMDKYRQCSRTTCALSGTPMPEDALAPTPTPTSPAAPTPATPDEWEDGL